MCSYSCVYCQVGRTLNIQTDPRGFYDPEEIMREVDAKLREAQQAPQAIDYLTFVPDGEPTLDVNLGRSIDLLKPTGIKIAVISNGSLVWREEVRTALMKADWVSLKVDSTTEPIWRRTNRPHRSLELDAILNGMLEFRSMYRGELVTETMLVEGVNDGVENLEAVAGFLRRLKPANAYLAIPTRPPAEKRVHAPDEQTVNRAYQILARQAGRVEYLIGYEGNAFAATGNPEEDLLSITAVHPMREEAVGEFLRTAGSDWSVVRELCERTLLIETAHDGHKYYVRRFPKRSDDRVPA
ncbi:MAG: radical SAM protein [Spirochaetales bacterium]|nr:radical SAM protein [Spirochaetales bacterium]